MNLSNSNEAEPTAEQKDTRSSKDTLSWSYDLGDIETESPMHQARNAEQSKWVTIPP